jgi:hypothetical protein
MHLVGPHLTNLKDPKAKKLKIDDKLLSDYRDHNKFLNRVGLKKMTLDEYIANRYGKKKGKKQKSSLSVRYADIPKDKLTKEIKADKNSCAKKDPKQYSGSRRLLGIAVMHKSNLVPVFDKESAEEISRMRR